MKISDEQLQAWIELLETAEPKSDAAMQNIIPLAVARELQQLREERHWRPISELKDYEEGKYFQLALKDDVNPMLFWHVDGELRSFAEPEPEPEEALLLYELPVFYDAWRPLPMGLPEVE